jgi:hypothetical protein
LITVLRRAALTFRFLALNRLVRRRASLPFPQSEALAGVPDVAGADQWGFFAIFCEILPLAKRNTFKISVCYAGMVFAFQFLDQRESVSCKQGFEGSAGR